MPKTNMPAVVVVTFPTPKDLDDAALRRLLEQAAPDYINISGLRRKYFLSGDGVGGGVYEWDSRSQAEAFYDEAWYAMAQERHGAVPQVVMYDVAAIADGVQHQLEIFVED